MSILNALKSFKETKEQKLINKAIRSKDEAPPETIIQDLIKLMSDPMSKHVIVQTLIRAFEKSNDEKKFIRLLCVLYRLMDIDQEYFILAHFSTSRQNILKGLPKVHSKTTAVFASHMSTKILLYNTYKILLSAENDVPDLNQPENVDLAFTITEILIELAKNLTEADFSQAGIYFHVADILLLELTVAFYKINFYSSALANSILDFKVNHIERFIEICKNIDRVRHKYFTILSSKYIKEKFTTIPRLAFMPTGPLQKFLTKYSNNLRIGAVDKELNEEILKFNTTFQGDIVSNDQKIRLFINRPLISINQNEDSNDSLSRSVSRSASRSSSAMLAGSFDNSKLMRPAQSPHIVNTSFVAGKPEEQRKQANVLKPIATRATAKKEAFERSATSAVLLNQQNLFDDEDDETSFLI
ncbi:hypothetical protein EIN_153260 [Entamoeba invadens IP1]|uniref:ENTH domain-containing protein n=1 Tax=Entamoeba invadens IP1 TaxID=370355 RepID=A0A0A1U8U1_ENTIV|nr:hypothetical protein EIN_153260 [Entamoeba invadens IP1]ELP91319.1 hypothetical protein EIN_153260 [Entamoeba invadens IP1]|eukprot:XP_004258090.1 hypothetical protein EIN_153260 [Entamoeba invadens IP1]